MVTKDLSIIKSIAQITVCIEHAFMYFLQFKIKFMQKKREDIQDVTSYLNKINILFFNKCWDFEFPDYSSLNFPDMQFLYRREQIRNADVVIFFIPSLDLIPQELQVMGKRQGQIWIYWSFECEEFYPEFQKPEILELFDLMATYKLNADISMPYFNRFHHGVSFRQEPMEKTGFINAFFSCKWDKSGRFDLLRDLMSILEVHSFGKVLNNRSLEDDPYIGAGLGPESFQFKEKLVSQYKFSLAFENAIAEDYVTEKFFQPLIAGSVPVYLGAPNIEKFAPGDHCFINVSQFSSTNELAEYLTMLDNNDNLYNQYFNWKKLPFRREFVELQKHCLPEDGIQQVVNVVRTALKMPIRAGL